MNPKFYDRVVDTGETGEDGKPTYRVVPYFLYQVDANNTVDRASRDEDKDRFPAEWALYERSRQPEADGFPLAAWPGIGAAERQGLADRGIFTVEKLAETNMAKAPADLRDAQDRAKAFLEKTSQDGPKLAARIAELEDERATMLEQIEDMKSAIEDLKSDAAAPKLEKKVQELEGELERSRGEVSRLQESVTTLNASNDELGQKLAEASKPAPQAGARK